jgi:hypothetical protein
MAKLTTIQMLLAITSQFGWQVHQMDIKSAFFSRNLSEEVYMEQPGGFVVQGEEKLVKALSGLKQGPMSLV